MHNVLQILRRDLQRLVTVPAAWVIMIGLILIPPLYAWFNIYGSGIPMATRTASKWPWQHGRRHRQRAAWQSQSRRSNRRHAEEQRPARLDLRHRSRGHGPSGIRQGIRSHHHSQRLFRRSRRRGDRRQESAHSGVLRQRKSQRHRPQSHRRRRVHCGPHGQFHIRLHRIRSTYRSHQYG